MKVIFLSIKSLEYENCVVIERDWFMSNVFIRLCLVIKSSGDRQVGVRNFLRYRREVMGLSIVRLTYSKYRR